MRINNANVGLWATHNCWHFIFVVTQFWRCKNLPSVLLPVSFTSREGRTACYLIIVCLVVSVCWYSIISITSAVVFNYLLPSEAHRSYDYGAINLQKNKSPTARRLSSGVFQLTTTTTTTTKHNKLLLLHLRWFAGRKH